MKLRHLLPALLLGVLSLGSARASVSVSIDIAPPALPVYVQPACPVEGYLWTPGYWAYDEDAGEYYYVSGVWVAPPRIGFLWTPGYWGFRNGYYAFNDGYWGPTVGFYGGVDYGYGYGGHGYYGGRWEGRSFRYNTAITHVNTTIIHNTYVDRTIINQAGGRNRTSFNGGRGGVTARPTPQELAARGSRVKATPEQISKRQAARASGNRAPAHANGPDRGNRNRPTADRGPVRDDRGGRRQDRVAKPPTAPRQPVRNVSRGGGRPVRADRSVGRQTVVRQPTRQPTRQPMRQPGRGPGGGGGGRGMHQGGAPRGPQHAGPAPRAGGEKGKHEQGH